MAEITQPLTEAELHQHFEALIAESLLPLDSQVGSKED